MRKFALFVTGLQQTISVQASVRVRENRCRT